MADLPPREPNALDATSRDEGGDASRKIPVVEEAIELTRVSEESGAAVRVRIVGRDEAQTVLVDELVEDLVVERVALNRVVEARSGPREEDGVLIVPVYETVAVVETRLVLKEELRIVRHRRQVQREEKVVLYKEQAIVERRESQHDAWRADEAPRAGDGAGEQAAGASSPSEKSPPEKIQPA